MSKTRSLSEFDSKRLLHEYGVPTVAERLAANPEQAVRSAIELGFPVAAKLCATGLAHKTERGVVRLGLATEEDVRAAAAALLEEKRPSETDAAVLVQAMVRGRRELIAGLVRDAQFGPCVMFGLGGILTEAIGDVAFRLAPLSTADALDMIDDLQGSKMLGPFRGDPAVDRESLAAVLVGLGRLGAERPDVHSVDVNPLIVHGADVVAVDALVEEIIA